LYIEDKDMLEDNIWHITVYTGIENKHVDIV